MFSCELPRRFLSTNFHDRRESRRIASLQRTTQAEVAAARIRARTSRVDVPEATVGHLLQQNAARAHAVFVRVLTRHDGSVGYLCARRRYRKRMRRVGSWRDLMNNRATRPVW